MAKKMSETISLNSVSTPFSQQIKTAYLSKPFSCLGLIFITLLVVCAAIIPFISPYTYYSVDLMNANQPPSLHHWFGTDDLGRDLFTRIWYGARISLFVGITAAMIDLFIGMLWGGIAGLAGGKTDEYMMRFTDILSALPSLLLIIPLIVIFGTGLHTIIIALSVIGWITMARVVRGQVIQIKQQGFITASIGLGGNFWHILFRHILPNAVGPILITLTLTIPSAIFTEAFLSYLGLGVQAPISSWGTMANEGLPALEYYPWRIAFPGFFISLTIFAFNLVGEGLNDAFSIVTRADA